MGMTAINICHSSSAQHRWRTPLKKRNLLGWQKIQTVISRFVNLLHNCLLLCKMIGTRTRMSVIVLTTNNDDVVVVVDASSIFLTCHHNGHIILTLIPHFLPQDIFWLMPWLCMSDAHEWMTRLILSPASVVLHYLILSLPMTSNWATCWIELCRVWGDWYGLWPYI